MKSGITAAECIFENLTNESNLTEVAAYPEQLKQTWLWDELKAVRNIRPGFRHGLLLGLLNAGLKLIF